LGHPQDVDVWDVLVLAQAHAAASTRNLYRFDVFVLLSAMFNEQPFQPNVVFGHGSACAVCGL
jgi:hypothetical protein